MDAIRVGAESRCAYGDGVNADILAVVEPEVELWAVLDSNPVHCDIGAHREPQSLQVRSNIILYN